MRTSREKGWGWVRRNDFGWGKKIERGGTILHFNICNVIFFEKTR